MQSTLKMNTLVPLSVFKSHSTCRPVSFLFRLNIIANEGQPNKPKENKRNVKDKNTPRKGNRLFCSSPSVGKQHVRRPWYHYDTFSGGGGSAFMSTSSARPASADLGVTAPSPAARTKECTAVVFLRLRWRRWGTDKRPLNIRGHSSAEWMQTAVGTLDMKYRWTQTGREMQECARRPAAW